MQILTHILNKLLNLLEPWSESVSCSAMFNSLRPMDFTPPGSSVHGILQARTLEWVAIPFFRGSSQSRDWTQVSHIAGRFFLVWAVTGASLF